MRHRAGDALSSPTCRWTKPPCARLVRRQIDAGINFLVPCGTTGESPTLTHAEHLRVVEITLEEAKGKVPRARRRRRLQHRRSDRPGPRTRSPGRRRPPLRHALLQQAHAGRPLPALQGHRLRRQLPIIVYSVQAAPASTSSPPRCSASPPSTTSSASRKPPATSARWPTSAATSPSTSSSSPATTPSPCRSSRLGGKRRHLVASNEIPAEMTALAQHCLDGDLRRRPRHPRKTSAPDGSQLHRIQPHPRQGRHGADGPARARLAPAPGSALSRQARPRSKPSSLESRLLRHA